MSCSEKRVRDCLTPGSGFHSAAFSAALKCGDVTAVAALCTYLELALLSHKKTNCATHFLKVHLIHGSRKQRNPNSRNPQESLAVAEQLDAAGDRTSLLFGVPVSVKEALPVSRDARKPRVAFCADPRLRVDVGRRQCAPGGVDRLSDSRWIQESR